MIWLGVILFEGPSGMSGFAIVPLKINPHRLNANHKVGCHAWEFESRELPSMND